MVFTSYIFIFVFLPITMLFAFLSKSIRSRNLLLVLSSYVFYAYWRLDFVFLLFLSTVLNFYLGLRIEKENELRNKRIWLSLGIAANLIFLGYFKYLHFFIENLNTVLDFLNLKSAIPLPDVLLPVGISFFTFHAISYLVDIYRGKVGAAKDLRVFAAYMSLFPQLVAGPIVRFCEVAEQFKNPLKGREYLVRGILLFVIGFNKKILIANNLAPIADQGFALVEPSMMEAWLAAFAYTFQLYFDFSGYSDMAVGLGLMLGFSFPMNFNSPYKATSIVEFWRRWHMTLSRFLRDYLYIPLGGSHHGQLATVINLFIVMFLGGLWHGAAWTFVIWGIYHGVLLILEHLTRRNIAPVGNLSATLHISTTFILVLIGWVLFRSETLAHAVTMLKAMFGFGQILSLGGLGPYFQPVIVACFLAAGAIVFFCRNSWDISENMVWRARWAHLFLFVLSLNEMFRQEFNPFLYFQF